MIDFLMQKFNKINNKNKIIQKLNNIYNFQIIINAKINKPLMIYKKDNMLVEFKLFNIKLNLLIQI